MLIISVPSFLVFQFLFTRYCTSFSRSHSRFATRFVTPSATLVDIPVREDGINSLVGLKYLKSFDALEFSTSPSSKDSQPLLYFLQDTSGPIPRSHMRTVLSIASENCENIPSSIVLTNVFEDALNWFLDVGGRIKNLVVVSPTSLQPVLETLGCTLTSTAGNDDNTSEFKFNIDILKQHVLSRLASNSGNKFTLNNILGRIAHDLGDFKLAIDSYTNALLAKPGTASVFRNLGSAYHADKNEQMAFASYQQAVSLDPTDVLVYLKLAFFYEAMAGKDWKQSYENAVQCYRYYLDKLDPEDTSVLTRLGNLLLRGGETEEALQTYRKAIELDPWLHVAWFNSAHALIRLGSYEGACESLRRTLELDPDNAAAKHMLTALSPENASVTTTADPEYVRQLFDDYGDDYDKHTRLLRYSAPRVLRAELAKLYKSRYEAEMARRQTQNPDYTPPSYLTYMERKLDILDLGCGTGQVGKWLKDYAKGLVGVDLSHAMVERAKSKLLYTELHEASIGDYLAARPTAQFDVVVAADVFQYIGDIAGTLVQSFAAVRPGGHLVFTVETGGGGGGGTLDDTCANTLAEKGFLLQRSGRFAFSKTHVSSLLGAMSGLSTVVELDLALRYDAGEPVPGCLFIAQKL